jgi:hypothetical protein
MSANVSDAEWKRLQKIVLQRLHDRYDSMSNLQRNMRGIHFQDEETMEDVIVSPNDAIQEVTALSDVGKKIIQATIKHLAQLQP